jgi:biopolymer transport protein ExbD
MGMSTSHGDDGRPRPTVNVTPLVDVALVVLIIFMMVTPMITKTFWLNLPKEPDEAEPVTPPPPDEENQPLVMVVDEQGNIHINTIPIDRSELGVRLPRMLAKQKQPVLYFHAKDAVPYGVAVEAMDAARGAGARSIAILTEKPAE